MNINLSAYWKINESNQFISIFGDDDKLPLLLYIHGGPGDAALPLVYKYNRVLSKHFNVVVWEQRGAGKSYYSFQNEEHITIQTFINDLHTLVNHLLKKFDQEKLYLLGHSWGSVLGLTFAKEYPHLIHTYFGCGQVVDMKEGLRRQYDFVLEESEKRNKSKITARLNNTDLSLTQENWLKDLLFITKLVVKYKHSLYGKSNYNTFVKDFIFSSTYTWRDLINREKGSLQSIQYLWQELMTIDFSNETDFDIPIIF